MLHTAEQVKIVTQLKNVTVVERESVTLTCELSKSDRTDGRWLHNGTEVTQTDRVKVTTKGTKQSLSITEATAQEVGQYTYSIESATTAATLTVEGEKVVLLF